MTRALRLVALRWRCADYAKAWRQRGLVGVGVRAAFGVELLVLRIGAIVGVHAAGDRLAELRQGTADRVVEVLRLRDGGMSAADIAERLDEPLTNVEAVLRLALILEELR